MKTKEIPVGNYVHLATWKPGDKLWSDWIEEDPTYSEELKQYARDEEILPAGEYTLEIDYPLSVPFSEKRVLEFSYTREMVVAWIVNRYKLIYDIEKETSSVPVGHIPNMLNRNNTTGEYGIWGHDLEDLDLHTIYVDENNKITLGVDS